MNTYIVTMTRTVYDQVTVKVDAHSETEARRIANELADELDPGKLSWETYDIDRDKPQDFDVEISK